MLNFTDNFNVIWKCVRPDEYSWYSWDYYLIGRNIEVSFRPTKRSVYIIKGNQQKSIKVCVRRQIKYNQCRCLLTNLTNAFVILVWHVYSSKIKILTIKNKFVKNIRTNYVKFWFHFHFLFIFFYFLSIISFSDMCQQIKKISPLALKSTINHPNQVQGLIYSIFDEFINPCLQY